MDPRASYDASAAVPVMYLDGLMTSWSGELYPDGTDGPLGVEQDKLAVRPRLFAVAKLFSAPPGVMKPLRQN